MQYFLKAMVRELMLVPLCVALLFSLSSCEVPRPDPPPVNDVPPKDRGSPDPLPLPNGTIDFAREPRYAEQWYLKNTGQQEGIKEIDINIEPVWKKGYGKKPVYVGILDQTIDRTHPDLQANIPPDNVITDGFVPYRCYASHGTRVAGLLASRDNGVGIIGVAPRAILYSYGIFRTIETSRTVMSERTMKALQRDEYKKIAVYNGSYGDPSESRYNNMSTPLKQAIQDVIDHGFYDKGSNFVFSAGNSGRFFSSSHNSYLNHYAVIAVNGIMNTGSINSSTGAATEGENIWITAPSELITTNTQQGGCHQESGYTKFGGTSASAPLVSGAIALLRSEYPDLTWRDVKLIIAESARKHDNEKQISYRESGRMYSDPSKQQTYHRIMGFGLLDVDAMFSLAKNWIPLPPMKTDTVSSQFDAFSMTDNKKYTLTLPIQGSNIQFIESLTIEIGVEIIKGRNALMNWLLQLIAPDGKKVAPIFTNLGHTERWTEIPGEVTSLTFLVNSFLGSSADGVWKLEIQQNNNVVIKKITRWSITFRGH